MKKARTKREGKREGVRDLAVRASSSHWRLASTFDDSETAVESTEVLLVVRSRFRRFLACGRHHVESMHVAIGRPQARARNPPKNAHMPLQNQNTWNNCPTNCHYHAQLRVLSPLCLSCIQKATEDAALRRSFSVQVHMQEYNAPAWLHNIT